MLCAEFLAQGNDTDFLKWLNKARTTGEGLASLPP